MSLYCLVVSRITQRIYRHFLFNCIITSFAIINSWKSKTSGSVLCQSRQYRRANRCRIFHSSIAGKIKFGENLPMLQNSKFGWVISGSIPDTFVVSRSINRQVSNVHTCLFTRNESIDDTLHKFWELEEYDWFEELQGGLSLDYLFVQMGLN